MGIQICAIQRHDSVSAFLSFLREERNIVVVSDNRFLDWEGASGKKNRTRLLERLQTDPEFSEDYADFEASQLGIRTPVPKGTQFVIDLTDIEQALFQANQHPTPAFRTSDVPIYTQYEEEVRRAMGAQSAVSYIHAGVTALVYSHSLEKWLNISHLVFTCNIGISMGGGTFQMELSPNFNEEEVQVPINLQLPAALAHDIQKNDLIFLANKRLFVGQDIEGFLRSAVGNGGTTFDLIGLVTDVTENVAPASSSLTLNISGEDLMKVFKEDGTYFFPNERILTNQATLTNQAPDQVSAEISPTSVINDDPQNPTLNQRQFAVLNTVGRVRTTGAATEVGDERRQLNFTEALSVPGWISKVRTILSYSGFVEDSVMDTIVPTPPRTSFSEVEDEDPFNKDVGVWRLIDFIFSDDLFTRFLTYGELMTYRGDMLSAIRRIVQDPFVEVFGDTYGARWSLVTRKPPFEPISILEQLDKDEKGNFTKIIQVENNNVLSYSFRYESEQNFYAWYRITPVGQYVGFQSRFAALIPTLIFPEYARLWGSHVLAVTSNYIQFAGVAGDSAGDNRRNNTMSQSVLEDLKYLVDISAYLPFTRRGSIKIQYEPRVKRGTWLYFSPTRELCYVDSVSHNFDCSEGAPTSTTNLEVSRAMLERYVIPPEREGFSYFKVLPTPVRSDLDFTDSSQDYQKNYTQGWKVDIDQFSFFLRARRERRLPEEAPTV